ncbi:MAG: hypothetical protein O2798_02075 [Chloroflexi bacterium]|nr:hypothetical protein [Chloroflexota bacterium]MDA1239608.1 hypothetical protein [Chloroflexota bacterium]
MAQQYVANDPRSGLEVQVTGEFPGEPDDRVRIARTTNLFTRLMSTILSTENDTERRERFKAIETQLEVADALVRGDTMEVQRLFRETLHQAGITEEHLAELEQQLRDQFAAAGAEFPPIFGEQLTRTHDEASPEGDDRPAELDDPDRTDTAPPAEEQRPQP